MPKINKEMIVLGSRGQLSVKIVGLKSHIRVPELAPQVTTLAFGVPALRLVPGLGSYL